MDTEMDMERKIKTRIMTTATNLPSCEVPERCKFVKISNEIAPSGLGYATKHVREQEKNMGVKFYDTI
jgi:hypothetical protein